MGGQPFCCWTARSTNPGKGVPYLTYIKGGFHLLLAQQNHTSLGDIDAAFINTARGLLCRIIENSNIRNTTLLLPLSSTLQHNI